jgi:hypothetical protein
MQALEDAGLLSKHRLLAGDVMTATGEGAGEGDEVERDGVESAEEV